MTLIAGASQYLNQATLAQQQGSTTSSSSLLTESVSSSLLDVGRNTAVGGVGLSPQARALNAQQIEQSAGTYNQLFSTGATATTEQLQTQILGIRASLPESRISEGVLLGSQVDEEV